MVTKSTVPSGSVPARSTGMVGASSAPLDVDGVAFGRSMTGVTVMTSLAGDAETLPSLSVTVNGIVTVPLKLAALQRSIQQLTSSLYSSSVVGL